MTNEQLFDDLKQLITTTVSQSEQRLRTEMATKEDLASLRQELKHDIKDAQEAIGDAIDRVNKEVDTTLKDHDKRIRRLEHKLA
jgi:gas vesicle protein